MLFCGYTLDSSGLTLDDWLSAGEEVRKKTPSEVRTGIPHHEVGGSCGPFIACPGMAERFWRGVEQTLSRRAPAIAATFVGLDRVCARATLPLSGAGRGSKSRFQDRRYGLVAVPWRLLLISNGENVKVAQSQLRHTTPKITLELYAQAVSADQQKAHKKVVQMVLPARFPEKLKARSAAPTA